MFIKQAMATLGVGEVIVIRAVKVHERPSYRVPPAVRRHAKDFQYKIKTFNAQDGVVQIMRTG